MRFFESAEKVDYEIDEKNTPKKLYFVCKDTTINDIAIHSKRITLQCKDFHTLIMFENVNKLKKTLKIYKTKEILNPRLTCIIEVIRESYKDMPKIVNVFPYSDEFEAYVEEFIDNQKVKKYITKCKIKRFIKYTFGIIGFIIAMSMLNMISSAFVIFLLYGLVIYFGFRFAFMNK